MDQVDRIIQSIYAESDYADSKNSIKQVLSTKSFASISDEFNELKVVQNFFQRLMFLRKDFNSIYIYNSRDKFFSYALNGTNKLDYDPIGENWYKETVAADGRTVISVPHKPYQLNYNKEVISYSRLLKNIDEKNADPYGVILIDLSIDSLNSIIDKVNLGETTGVLFLDMKGKAIYADNMQVEDIDLAIIEQEMMKNADKGKFTAIQSNKKYLISFSTSMINGWKLLTFTPYSEITKVANQLVLFDLLLGMVALFFAIGLAYTFSRLMFKPIHKGVMRALWERSATTNRYLLPQGTQSCADAELVIDFGIDGPAIGAGQTKTLRFTLTNRSLIPLDGSLSLELPKDWGGPYAHKVRLQPDESVQWDVEIRASAVVAAYHELAFYWTRNHDHSIWAAQQVPFTLVGASRWCIWGPEGGVGKEIYVPGNRLEWEKELGSHIDGVYRAQTTLSNPSERKLRLIAAANGPITLKLNGQVVIECKETLEFMPAYHRTPQEQWVEMSLPAGTHMVELEASRNGCPLEVYVLPVALWNTTTPGPHYYLNPSWTKRVTSSLRALMFVTIWNVTVRLPVLPARSVAAITSVCVPSGNE